MDVHQVFVNALGLRLGRGNEIQAGRNEIKASRNKIQARRNKIQIRRNKIQMPIPSTNPGFSMGYRRFR